MSDVFSYVCCPVCGASLHRDGGSLFCENPGKRHCFDLAASGYVNLLPPGKAGNAHTGDDKGMIRARSRFLALGLYDPISLSAASLAAETLGERENLFVLDAGCGEGYHSCLMAETLHEKSGAPVTLFGFDASKHGAEAGAKLAARRGLTEGSVRVAFAAGNLFSLPVPTAAADCVFSLFAPIAGEENIRALKNDGVLVVGAAGKRHLWQLRELLYDTPRESEGEIRTPDGFTAVAEKTLRVTVHVPSNEALRDLFHMTPFAWRTSPEAVRRLDAVDSLTVSIEVLFRAFRKS